MINRAEFKKILDMEEEAFSLYSALYAQIPDSPIREKLKEIRDDEKKHVEIAKKMLEIVDRVLGET